MAAFGGMFLAENAQRIHIHQDMFEGMQRPAYRSACSSTVIRLHTVTPLFRLVEQPNAEHQVENIRARLTPPPN